MPFSTKRHLSALATLAAVVAAAAPCMATTPEDGALAEQLFRDGKERMTEGNYTVACPKLAESHRLDPAGGTLLTLALCHESEGRTASAWAEFADALALARRDQRADREAISREHIDALGPRLRRLRMRVSPEASAIADLAIKRDGALVGRAGWDAAAPVDPGEHLIEASASGYQPFTTRVTVGEPGVTTFVDLVPLVPLAQVAAGDAPLQIVPLTPERGSSGLRVTSYVVGGVAIASLGVGVAFAVIAKGKRDDANDACPLAVCSDPAAVEASRSAGRSADLATGAFIASAVMLVGSITFFVLSSPESRASASARPPGPPALLRF